MSQPPATSTNQVYNDGALQYGAFFATVKRGATRAAATTVGVYYFETFNIDRPLKKITQPDEIGGPNGFALVNDYNTASFTLQIGPSTNARPINGDWLEITQNATVGLERWVMQINEPFEVNSYFKTTGTAHKASFPT